MAEGNTNTASLLDKNMDHLPVKSSRKSLDVLLGVLAIFLVAASGFLYFENSNLKKQLAVAQYPTTNANKCVYNDQSFQPGESFSAVDGCNTCSCTETGEVACTEMACNIEDQINKSITPYTPQNGTYHIPSKRYGYSTIFADTGTINAHDCFVEQNYSLVVTLKEKTKTGDGPCGVEGPTGIRISKFEKSFVNGFTCSAIGHSPVEHYAFSETTNMKNNYQITTCRFDLIGPEMGEMGPRPKVKLATYITTDASPWIYNLSLTDEILTSTYDQILSTFEFTE